jgi:beta-lactamase class D
MRKLLVALLSIAVLFSACSINNVTVDDSIGRFFDSAHVKGCFALYDNGQGHFTVYNLPRYRDSAYPPGETFDIIESLVAFQNGVMKDDKSIAFVYNIGLDSNGATINPPIRKPYSMKEIFQSPNLDNIIGFGLLADSIGNDSIRKWVDSLHYGDEAFAKDSGLLKIPADQQLGLIKKLYFNQLPFFNRTQELVRDMMITESNTNYKLAYKTGRLVLKNGVFGWIMGWVEENKHPYFFVLNYDSPDQMAMPYKVGPQLIKQILPSMGFFEGKK